MFNAFPERVEDNRDSWHPMPSSSTAEMLQRGHPGKPKSWCQFLFPGFQTRSFTFFILVVNMIVFAVSLALPSGVAGSAGQVNFAFTRFLEPPRCTLFLMGGKWAPAIRFGHAAHRLVLPAFLHGSLWHLLENTLAIMFLGFLPEHAFSSRRTGTGMWESPISILGAFKVALLYFTCAATGSLCSAIGDARELSVGASAGIMGLLGAIAGIMCIIWLRESRMRGCKFWCANGLDADIQRFRSMAIMVVILVAMTYILGLIPGPTDNWGHLGGMVMGFFMAPLLIPRLGDDTAAAAQVGAVVGAGAVAGAGGGEAQGPLGSQYHDQQRTPPMSRGYIGYMSLSMFLSLAFVGGLVGGLFAMPMQNIDVGCGGGK